MRARVLNTLLALSGTTSMREVILAREIDQLQEQVQELRDMVQYLSGRQEPIRAVGHFAKEEQAVQFRFIPNTKHNM